MSASERWRVRKLGDVTFITQRGSKLEDGEELELMPVREFEEFVRVVQALIDKVE